MIARDRSCPNEVPSNAGAPSDLNLGAAIPALMDAVKARVQALRDADPGNTRPVPVDLVAASGSGFDQHISPAAKYQLARVAQVRTLVAARTEGCQFDILVEPTVNVLERNLALDAR